MLSTANVDRLPDEMKQASQWMVAGPDKSGYVAKIPGMFRGDVKNPMHHSSFDETKRIAALCKTGMGIALMQSDPWTIIDLDVVNEQTQIQKKQKVDPSLWTTEKDFERYQRIVDQFDSYTEVSSGGLGLHIVVRGAIGAGVKFGNVEVYSQERFMICTGQVYHDRPIAERQNILSIMVEDMRARQGAQRYGKDGEKYKLVELPQTEDDSVIVDRLLSASNDGKAGPLFSGEWQTLGYPSQSEADLAFMSMLTFYSESNEQCRRIFRLSGLGKREKAVEDNRYLNLTLQIVRARQEAESQQEGRMAEISADLIQNLQQNKVIEETVRQMEDDAGGSSAVAILEATAGTALAVPIPPEDSTVGWPPGVFGQIAAFIYNSSIRPIKEVAIVSALGMVAGICGKAFNTTTHSGLNLYVTLVAKSGVGKEALHSGMSLILNDIRSLAPSAQSFIDFVEYKSGAGLSKAILARKSFVNVSSEWGRRLKRMADDRQDGVMADLRTTLTHLYQKSGHGSDVGGLGYSDSEKNIDSVTGVAYSMIGETTPGTFYECLTPSMMEDGFMSRFVIVDYQGDRPESNKAAVRSMPPHVSNAVIGLCKEASSLNDQNAVRFVEATEIAQKMLDDFDLEADAKIRATQDESVRQMWNRAHLKVLKVASLLAVCDNWMFPKVAVEHVAWALGLIRNDIKVMSRKMDEGEIGMDDHARERKMLAVLRHYAEHGSTSESYGCPKSLHGVGIISRRLIQIKLSRVPQFMAHRQGATVAMEQTLKVLIANGYLTIADPKYLVEKHSYSGACYRIVSLPEVKGKP